MSVNLEVTVDHDNSNDCNFLLGFDFLTDHAGKYGVFFEFMRKRIDVRWRKRRDINDKETVNG